MNSFLVLVWLLSLVLCISGSEDAGGVASAGQVSKSTGPPAFFLQDVADGYCLAGDTYRRCSIDTLWYVTGKPGAYSIHHRLRDEADDDSCLGKAQCHLDESPAQLVDCGHCGAKKWNIVGDNDTGYVLTEDGNKNCVKRVGNKVAVVPCSKGYSGLSLHFATKDHISIMGSDGARFITAAAEDDLKAVKNFLSVNKVDVNARDWDNLTALIASSGKGHFNVVKHLVSSKADVNLRDKDNITALTEAAMGGHKNIVEYLVNNKAEVDCLANTGVSPLWVAAGEGYVDVVKVLLNKKADPNNRRVDNVTALMIASSGGHTEVVRHLLKGGASVDLSDKDGMTALISASENGSLPVVKLLLEYKANVNAVSNTSFTPLIMSSAHGHIEVVKSLVTAGAEIDMDHKDSITALMYAAAGGFPDVVSFLINKGANVNARHKQGGTALLEACTTGNVSVINALLAANADPMVLDDEGVSTLMSAAAQGHEDVVKILIEKGVPVNGVAKSGGTALMFAAGGGHNATVRLLLDNKADVNILVAATPEYIEQVAKAIGEGKEDVEPHKDGVTALHVAAQGGFLSTVQLLVEAGAAVSIIDDEGMSPLLNAVKGNFGEVAKYLVQNGANPNEVFIDEKAKPHNLLMDAVVVNNTQFALLLIKKGANLSFVDDDGLSVTTQAAFQGQLEIVQALLAKDVDVSVANNEGINPLIAASSEGHDEIVKMLLATNKCDLNSKDKDGTNSLMAASVRGHKTIVDLLLEKGVEVNAQNADGHTALMFAYNGKNQVETLLDKYSAYMKDDQENSTKIIKDALQTHVDVVNLLLAHKADPNIKDKEGHTASDFDYKPPSSIPSLPMEGGITPDASAAKEEL